MAGDVIAHMESFLGTMDGALQITAVKGNRRIPLIGVPASRSAPTPGKGGTGRDTMASDPGTSKTVRKARKSA
jgi:hypothetical protein